MDSRSRAHFALKCNFRHVPSRCDALHVLTNPRGRHRGDVGRPGIGISKINTDYGGRTQILALGGKSEFFRSDCPRFTHIQLRTWEGGTCPPVHSGYDHVDYKKNGNKMLYRSHF
ncbi:hypothetical protein EVAR_21987_1 [Eumeta japonica]|uniref:Uncharacterized protein n=1 Tax=Eumeta variegata TaxID=151549 RepID=A0A4C1VVC2_EUMVA|nr:hypothetical protein EVAR_21987_1 [Eumeta japonica]